jgi:hypothetical protein
MPLLTCTLMLLLGIPGTGHSTTLDQLLDMPIEQLLRLKITSRPPPQVAVPWRASPIELRAVEQRDAT